MTCGSLNFGRSTHPQHCRGYPIRRFISRGSWKVHKDQQFIIRLHVLYSFVKKRILIMYWALLGDLYKGWFWSPMPWTFMLWWLFLWVQQLYNNLLSTYLKHEPRKTSFSYLAFFCQKEMIFHFQKNEQINDSLNKWLMKKQSL